MPRHLLNTCHPQHMLRTPPTPAGRQLRQLHRQPATTRQHLFKLSRAQFERCLPPPHAGRQLRQLNRQPALRRGAVRAAARPRLPQGARIPQLAGLACSVRLRAHPARPPLCTVLPNSLPRKCLRSSPGVRVWCSMLRRCSHAAASRVAPCRGRRCGRLGRRAGWSAGSTCSPGRRKSWSGSGGSGQQRRLSGSGGRRAHDSIPHARRLLTIGAQ